MESLDGLLRNFHSGENVLKNQVLQKQEQIRESLQGDSTPFSLREWDIVDEIYSRLRGTLDSILEPPYFNLTDQSLIIVTSEIETQLLLFFANTDLSQIPVDFSFSRAKIQIVKRANGTIGHGEWNQRPGAISFFLEGFLGKRKKSKILWTHTHSFFFSDFVKKCTCFFPQYCE